MNRQQMIEALRKGYCNVEFTKVNGETRIMECTLKEDMIPDNMRPKTDGNLTEGVERTIDVIKAYDVRAAGWRSFKVDNVLNFESYSVDS